MKTTLVQLFSCIAMVASVNVAHAGCITTGTINNQRTVCTNTQVNIIGSGASSSNQANIGSMDSLLSQTKSPSVPMSNLLNYDLSSLYRWKK